jgi:hypothetical protein
MKFSSKLSKVFCRFLQRSNKKLNVHVFFKYLLKSSDTQKIVTNSIRYVLNIDTLPIRFDTRIEKVSVKSVFLNKKIIFDTCLIRPGTRIEKVSVK